jgi:hypothetical protein
MGQYHKIVNLDKREFIDPFGLSMGQKALEQLLSEVSTQEALFLLLMCSNGRGGGDVSASDPYGLIGRWAGDRIAVVGDYTEDGDLGNYSDLYDDSEVYSKCRSADPGPLEQLAAAAENEIPRPNNGNFLDLSPYLRPLMEQVFGLRYKEERSGGFTFYMREFDNENR